MAVYLVRHADAGARREWHQPDDLRTLTARGRREADAAARWLGERPVTRILSSPALRCRETVQPLAERLGLEVGLERALLEGAPLQDAVALVRAVAGGDVVVCSHGDVIPDVLSWLMGKGMRTGPDRRCQKGSIWVLEADGAEFVRGEYVPPPCATG
ncbi:MAG: SixA phosphatase family protein [Actinomycetota bacterium]